MLEKSSIQNLENSEYRLEKFEQYKKLEKVNWTRVGYQYEEPETFKKFKDKKGFSAMMSEPVATRMMLVNTTKGALTDKNVRKALQHVLNKKEISEGIFEGTETPADTILAKTVPYANINVPVYNYSLDEAKKLLDAAGWTAGADGKRQKNGKP